MGDQKSAEKEDVLKQQVAELKHWLEEKPYVPLNIDDRIYLRFLHSCYYDIVKAKAAADLFFSIRSSSPELLTDRDPLSAPMQKTIKITKFGLYRISGNRNLWVWQLDDPGLHQYDHLLESKYFILAADSWMHDDDFLEEEDIVVCDVKDLSLKILMKFSYSVAKKMSKYQQEAIPLRQKAIHIVNAPNIIHRVFAIMKPFISKEMMKLIHIHTPNSTTIFDYLSRDELPVEFGGTRGKFSDISTETVASIIKNRELLIDDNFWRCDINERAKSKPVRVEATTEISSLRNLAID